MHLQVEAMSNKGIAVVRVEHLREILMIDVTSYKTASIPYREELFDDLNRFVERQPPETQNKLFQIYKDVNECFRTIHEPNLLHVEIKKLVNELYEHISYTSVRDYIYRSEHVIFPVDLKSDYTENDQRSRNYVYRTYLKPEYIDLVILTLGLRFMVPIWGEHISRIEELTGNDFKEMQALDLIKKSKIWQWEPRKRLGLYIEASIDSSKLNMTALLGCLSSTEIPDQLMSLAMTRKLSVSPISPKEEADSLIKILYNFITGTYARIDNKFGGNVKPKSMIDTGDDDDNSSVWDAYKTNQMISDGDKMLIEVYTEKPLEMAERVCPSIDLNLVRACLDVAMGMDDVIIEQHHETLAQYILKVALPVKALTHLPKTAMLRCMAVTQAVLWHQGHREIALLSMAERAPAKEDEFYMSMEPRSRVSRDLVKQLDVLYPFYRQESRNQVPGKRSNPAVKAIDILCDEILKHEWLPRAPEQLLKEFMGSNSRWFVSGNIKTQFAELIIQLHKR